ncbi:hypothetical protein DFH09DRAFT_1092233 [Mycena vulgaris]|nr:hypothetical protein DFH09DRAFT_1092233 [Mycena vulgaris]
MASQSERPYVEADLTGNKASLVRLVQRQLGKWPTGKFHQSKVTVVQLKSALLDPTYGFTTNKPAVAPPATFHAPSAPETQQMTSSVPPSKPATAPRDSLAPSETTVELLDLRIYIEDCRFTPSQKTVAILSVPVLDRMNCSFGGFRVLGREIISRLQNSNSAIEIPATGPGTIRISVPDREEPEWKVPFVRIAYGQPLDVIEFDPQALEVLENQRLKLFIDVIASPAGAVKSDSSSGSDLLNSVPATPADTDVAEEKTEDPAVKYLLDKLAMRPGYESFAANRGRVVANPEVVKDWRFAVGFTADYNKVKPPGIHTKITKALIQRALGIGSTWLASAQTAMQIIGTYGQNQPHATAEVISVLERVDDPAEGSAALYAFLTEWKKDHQV